MMTIKCYIDMDGVLVDQVDAICSAHSLINPYTVSDHKLAGIWDFIPHIADMPEAEFWSKISTDIWANMPPSKEFKEIINLVEDLIDHDNIAILTSPTTSNRHNCMEGKMLWIEKHLPKYSKHVIFCKKKYFCANPSGILIDDADHNIDDFINHSGQGVLVPRIWNRYHHRRDVVMVSVENELRLAINQITARQW